MKSTDMPARYVVGNLADLLSWDNINIQLRTITVSYKNNIKELGLDKCITF